MLKRCSFKVDYLKASVTGSSISNMLVFGNVCKLMTKTLHKALDRRQG